MKMIEHIQKLSVILMIGFVFGCNSHPEIETIHISEINKLDSGSIEYKEESGAITIWITDIFNEKETYIISYEKMSKDDALHILKMKRLELKKK